MGILHGNARAIAALMPHGAALIEFGAGSALKAKILLNAAPQIAAYVPVDISAEFLADEARKLERDIPRVGVHPVAADFTQRIRTCRRPCAAVRASDSFRARPSAISSRARRRHFCARPRDILGPDACFIVGADRVKDEAVLHAAYNDAAGVTAQFNLNLLTRINRELGGDFDRRCIPPLRELQSRTGADRDASRKPQGADGATCCGHTFDFKAGETIHTESSHKFTVQSFTAMARRRRLDVVRDFQRRARLFLGLCAEAELVVTTCTLPWRGRVGDTLSESEM